jgi:hypothetical protein
MGTVLHPTAGFIADVSGTADNGRVPRPGTLTPDERALLRFLAERVRDISAEPRQVQLRKAWISHGDLGTRRPMLLVFPEDSWIEIIGDGDLSLRDPFWRQWEWYLRMIRWRREHVDDDFVVEPELPTALVTRRGAWGVEVRYTRGGEKGSYVWDAPLKEPADLARVTWPALEPDLAATASVTSALDDVFHGILPVRVLCPVPGVNLIGEATMLRGLEQCMVDMYDNPGFLHELMAFLARGMAADLDLLESRGLLTLNNANQYTDSGGIGYTSDLPRAGGGAARGAGAPGGPGVRLSDLWGHGVAQELSGVSPAQHEEFVLEHQLPILERFGLVAYGCCEPYTHKFDMLKRRVPRLRRVSVSPWCDIPAAAAALQDRYIFSWKPTPAMLADVFHPDQVRRYIRTALEAARDCIVEIILKDTFTIQRDPRRVEEWTRIAREEIEGVQA